MLPNLSRLVPPETLQERLRALLDQPNPQTDEARLQLITNVNDGCRNLQGYKLGCEESLYQVLAGKVATERTGQGPYYKVAMTEIKRFEEIENELSRALTSAMDAERPDSGASEAWLTIVLEDYEQKEAARAALVRQYPPNGPTEKDSLMTWRETVEKMREVLMVPGAYWDREIGMMVYAMPTWMAEEQDKQRRLQDAEVMRAEAAVWAKAAMAAYYAQREKEEKAEEARLVAARLARLARGEDDQNSPEEAEGEEGEFEARRRRRENRGSLPSDLQDDSHLLG